ncbi:MAG: hypothetical protein U1E17_04990 [Geminicoccaceae bacterium]
MARLGFDFEAGRLDEHASLLRRHAVRHPHHHALRRRRGVTALMGVLHETGHALYESGLPARWTGQPVGVARGSVREPVAADRDAGLPLGRLHALPRRSAERGVRRRPAYTQDNLVRLYTRVERGFIRVNADEATYPASSCATAWSGG